MWAAIRSHKRDCKCYPFAHCWPLCCARWVSRCVMGIKVILYWVPIPCQWACDRKHVLGTGAGAMQHATRTSADDNRGVQIVCNQKD